MIPFASRVARTVDRLVLGINRKVGPRHGHVLSAVAGELGLDSLKLIPHFADFWMSGPLRRNVAEARLPYAPIGSLEARLDVLTDLDLIRESGLGSEATARFRPLLAGVLAAREDVVTRAWETLPAVEIRRVIQGVIDAIPETHTVAAAHRALTPAPDPALRLYDRLVTLRYLRQHDHVEAWRAAGMSAEEMKVITPLWYQEPPPDDPMTSSELKRRGLVEEGALTEEGRRARDEIEADTDRRGEVAWSVLDAEDQQRLLDALSEVLHSVRSLD